MIAIRENRTKHQLESNRKKGERKMKKNKANKIADKRELTKEEMKAVAGGIGTWPTPEKSF